MKTESLLHIYQELIEKLDSGVHIIDREQKTIVYNKRMMDIEGMSIEDVLDKNILDVFHFERDEESTLLHVLRNGESILNVKQTYFTRKGQEITTINNTYPLFEHGVCIGAVEIARDITKLDRLMKEQMTKKDENYTFNSIIGSSASILEVIENSKHATTSPSSILIIGEIGTGKELIAQTIHNESSRAGKPFIAQQCDSLDPAHSARMLVGEGGVIQLATGGTLLLSHIDRLSLNLQDKLLDILQSKKIKHDNIESPLNIQVIGTMQEDPIDAIAAGRLRKELYYKLSNYSIFVPPLRERQEDILELAQSFIDSYNLLFGANVKAIHQEVINALQAYDWPGNVRELERVMEESLSFVGWEEMISYHHLPMSFRQKVSADTEEDDKWLVQPNRELLSLEEYLQEAEKYYIQKALMNHDFNITKTAKSLRMSRQNLQYRIRKNQIERSPEK
ncbi:sigma-54 interaction domain-containing protein [Bacillus sp. 2205SS5-2]|uniref:sigma-54 interaction domain-containing protein n=1 Tax=Bacillus sp. 2205SS5-2 TaxID=3109031 RepID=UPI003005055B